MTGMALPGQIVEAELVLRDLRPRGWRFAGMILGLTVGFGLMLLRASYSWWRRGEQLPGGVFLFVSAIAVTCILLPFIRLPVWIQVGPTGMAFREWLRSGAYLWKDIASVEPGNPNDPRFAYIRLQSGQAVRLPAFDTIPANELVATLREKQRIYRRRG